MDYLQQRQDGWTSPDQQGANGLVGCGAGYEQPYGNAARASQLGLGAGTPSAWGVNDVALWAFGEDEDADHEQGECSPYASPIVQSAVQGRQAAEVLGQAGATFGRDPDAAPPPPPEVVAWVDSVVPVGFGVAASEELAGAAGFKVGEAFEGSIVNAGGGWFDLEVTGTFRCGGGVGVGAGALQDAAKADAGAGVEVRGTRGFHVPWTRLDDPQTLVALAAEAATGELCGQLTPRWLVERLVGGKDLDAYLMKEEVEGSVGGELEAVAEGMGERLALVASGHAGISASIEYDDVADDAGVRTGEVRFSGEVEELTELTADLAKTLGLHGTTMPIPHIATTATYVLPFTDRNGEKTYGDAYVEAGIEAGIGTADVKAGVELGGGRAALTLEAPIAPGTPPWTSAVDTVSAMLEVVTQGMVDLETGGTLTLKLKVPLADPEIPDPESLAPAVASWIRTGEVSDVLAPVLGVVQRLVAGAELKIAADLEFALDVACGVEAESGAELEGDFGGEGALVFERDDIVPDLDAPPTVDEAIAMIRAGGGALA